MENRILKDGFEILGLKEEVVRRIITGTEPTCIKDGNSYDVCVANLRFHCRYTDEEITRIADLCLELVEELRMVNINGYTRKDLSIDNTGDETDIIKIFEVYNLFTTPHIEESISQIAETTKAGGAYYLLISKPMFIKSIITVFDKLIDNFDDVTEYFTSLYFLVRMAMYMHCDDMSDEYSGLKRPGCRVFSTIGPRQ